MFDDALDRSPLPDQDGESDLAGLARSLRPAPGKSTPSSRLPGAGGGEPLPADIRRMLEQIGGAPLDGVRVHDDEESAIAAEGLGARAFTRGQHIHFAAGEYAPGTEAGRHLIAHEVAHTVQQGEVAAAPQAKLAVSEPGDALEVEADAFADAAIGGGPVAALTRGTATGDLVATKKKGGWAHDVAEAIFDPFADMKRQMGYKGKSLFGISETLADSFEGFLLGIERTGEGLGIGGEDRQVEIGVENENVVELIKKLLDDPTRVLEDLAAAVTIYTIGVTLAKLSEKERAKVEEAVAKKAGRKLVGAALELFIGSWIKSFIVKKLVTLISRTATYEMLTKALRLGPGDRAGGLGLALLGFKAQGLMQRASYARQRLKAHKQLFDALSRERLDMLFFLVEDQLPLFELVVKANLLRIELFGE